MATAGLAGMRAREGLFSPPSQGTSAKYDRVMDDAIRESQALLETLGLPKNATFDHSTTSAVTTSWGVHWDEDSIARDLLQNFFDANRDQLDRITIEVTPDTVRITGPSGHDLEQLFFLGSEKDPAANVGQYGEGFKAAAMCLVRDHGVRPVARSGGKIACIRLASAPVAGTALYPLVYDWFTVPTPFDGTEILLATRVPKLRAAVQAGMSHFFHERNVLVGSLRWKSSDSMFALYASTQSTAGAIFYRRLRRATVEGIPIVLVINKEYARVEKLIRGDRDRKAFGEKLLEVFYEVFVRSDIRWDRQAQRVVVEAARHVWSRGHPLLAAFAEVSRDAWPGPLAREVFGEKYFARSHSTNPSEHLQYDALERQWRDEGREPLPGYFTSFGVISAKQSIALEEKATLELNRRGPTDAERRSIDLLLERLKDLTPWVHALFARGQTKYMVARTDEIHGALKKGRSYHSLEVFLAERLFVEDFASALATFLHEHSHVFGYDGGRAFTDALTQMLETVVRTRATLDDAERQWEIVRKSVVDERRAAGAGEDGSQATDARLATMDEAQLRALLGRMPPAVLRRLLEDESRGAG